MLASRLAARGIERGANESLAETTARAMGISVRELRAEFWRRAGYTKLPIFADNASNSASTANWLLPDTSIGRVQPRPVRLSVMAYSLGNLWRRLVLPKRIDNWSLTSLQKRLVKTGGRQIKHGRYYWLLLAESYLTRRLFAAMVRRVAVLPVATG